MAFPAESDKFFDKLLNQISKWISSMEIICKKFVTFSQLERENCGKMETIVWFMSLLSFSSVLLGKNEYIEFIWLIAAISCWFLISIFTELWKIF